MGSLRETRVPYRVKKLCYTAEQSRLSVVLIWFWADSRDIFCTPARVSITDFTQPLYLSNLCHHFKKGAKFLARCSTEHHSRLGWRSSELGNTQVLYPILLKMLLWVSLLQALQMVGSQYFLPAQGRRKPQKNSCSKPWVNFYFTFDFVLLNKEMTFSSQYHDYFARSLS